MKIPKFERFERASGLLFVGVIVILSLLLSPAMSSATVIGANKGVVNFNNVLKQGYAQELVTLSTDTDFNLSVDYQVEGELKDWIRFEPVRNPFYISGTSPYTIAVIIEPPADAQIGKYSGTIRFITGALAGPEGQFGTAVRTAINLNIGVQVTGQQILSCSIPEVVMDDAEEGYPLEFRAVVSNDGNVRINPSFVLEFWNQDQSKIVKLLNITFEDSVLPTTQKRITKSLANDLPIGQYWVKVKSPLCGDAVFGFLTVSIIERGGVSDKGELVDIQNPIDANVGQIVPIDAVFSNLGSRVVSAKFKGTITSGSKDNIFKIIDTEPIDVNPGESVKLRTYFNPTQEGQYLITGRVLYNRKLTFERSSVINIFPSQGGFLSQELLTPVIVLIVIIVAIVIVLALIIRRKKRR